MALPIREILPGQEGLRFNVNEDATTLRASIPMDAIPFRSIRLEHGASEALEIPLDLEEQKSITQERHEARVLKARVVVPGDDDLSDNGTAKTGASSRRTSAPRRRDSLRRREALLKGKEGSRRRQKWENDRLLGNPAFQPPEPHDWAPHPTHSVQNVPYLLAPLWDDHYAKVTKMRAETARQIAAENMAPPSMPKDLKEKLKRARGARTLLQQLEEQVRSFVWEWEEQQRLQAEGWDVDMQTSDAEDMSSEEEVVFVGRKSDARQDKRRAEAEVRHDKLVYDSLVNDRDGSFGRWLVHSIATYYDLQTWSVTTGDPARREAYVGIPDARKRRRISSMASELPELPRPLWVMV